MEKSVSRPKRPYLRPEIRKLNREQAALIMLSHAWDGDENAQELLERTADILFLAPSKNR